MNDIDILQQLLSGNHLENRDLDRALDLVIILRKEVEWRIK